MEDREFWLQLEYHACGWLRSDENRALRRFWCDGFLPAGFTDTKCGVDVEGTAWMGEGPRGMDEWRFVLSVPQKLLHRGLRSFAIAEMQLNETERTLWMEVRRLPQTTDESID